MNSLESHKGKIAPHAKDVEHAVLGECLLDSSAFSSAREIINAEVFYEERSRIIYQTFEELFIENTPIDLITVSSRLGKTQAHIGDWGGPFHLTQLTARVSGAGNIESHCRILLEKYFKREMIRIGMQMQQDGYDDAIDPMEMLNTSSTIMENMYGYITGTKQMSFSQQVSDTLDTIETAAKSEKHILGMTTGFKYRDILTSGRCNGTLSLIAARPSLGKSSLMLQEIINVSDQGIPVAIFSLEMSAYELIIKILANQLRLDSNAIRNGKSNLDMIRAACAELQKRKIYLYDASKQSVLQIKARAKTLVKKYGIKAIYVDYLQLADGNIVKGQTRDQEIGSISRGLKQIAKDLNIPVIALAQLSRAVETRGGEKRPQLSDIRESGNVEADCDVIEFLYRAEYYGIEEYPNGESTKDIAEGIIAKNRNGALGTYKTKFIRQHSKFEEITDYATERYYNPNARIEPLQEIF